MLFCIFQNDKPVDGWVPSPRRYSDTIELGIYRSHSFDPNLFNIREVSPDKIAVSDASTCTFFSIMFHVNVQEVVYMYVVLEVYRFQKLYTCIWFSKLYTCMYFWMLYTCMCFWIWYTCTCLGCNMVSTYQICTCDIGYVWQLNIFHFPGTINTDRFGIIKEYQKRRIQ